jgi:DNA-binding transcriptional regulator YiaG
MTESIMAATQAAHRRRGLGRWPVTPEMLNERDERMEKQLEEARNQRKAQAIDREREKAAAKKEGRKARKNVKTKPISTELLGGRIRDARMKLGVSMRDFADTQGIHLSEISEWERGVRVPTPAKMAALAQALGVTVTWLKEGRR